MFEQRISKASDSLLTGCNTQAELTSLPPSDKKRSSRLLALGWVNQAGEVNSFSPPELAD